VVDPRLLRSFRIQHNPVKLKAWVQLRHMAPLSEVIPRRTIAALACLAAVGLIAVGVIDLPRGASTGGPPAPITSAQTSRLLAGSPPALAALHAQGGALLEGGAGGVASRLSPPRGSKVVGNKWASWCVPCKAELGAFQRASAEYGRRVAFIGIDSADSSRGDAVAFLRSFPVSYPSYYDKSGRMGEQITDSSFTPVTVFIARDGHLSFIHQGQYPSAGKLRLDVEQYALNA
jgi:cytochrome c biogenesis protein CcmG, thiol:disulfide interchange protein DsbE